MLRLESMSRAVALHTSTTTLSSLASLSISSSVSPPGPTLPASSPQAHTGPVTIPVHSTPVPRRGVSSSVPVEDGFSVSGSPSGVMSVVTRNGKKRGTIFTCESCSKVRAISCHRCATHQSRHYRVAGLSPPVVLDQTPVGAHAPLARGVKVFAEQASTGATHGGM